MPTETLAAIEEMVTVPEAAGLLGVSTSTVRRWIDQSRVPAYRLGPKRMRLKRSELGCLLLPATVSTAAADVETSVLPMSDAERDRWSAWLDRARVLRAEQLAARGGVLFENGWELLNEARDERFEQL